MAIPTTAVLGALHCLWQGRKLLFFYIVAGYAFGAVIFLIPDINLIYLCSICAEVPLALHMFLHCFAVKSLTARRRLLTVVLHLLAAVGVAFAVVVDLSHNSRWLRT